MLKVVSEIITVAIKSKGKREDFAKLTSTYYLYFNYNSCSKVSYMSLQVQEIGNTSPQLHVIG